MRRGQDGLLGEVCWTHTGDWSRRTLKFLRLLCTTVGEINDLMNARIEFSLYDYMEYRDWVDVKGSVHQERSQEFGSFG